MLGLASREDFNFNHDNVLPFQVCEAQKQFIQKESMHFV